MVILVSIISILTTLIGLYYIGEKNKKGFILHTISVGCQAYLFYILPEPNWLLIAQMLVLAIFNIRNYFKWKYGEI
jgi:hypothetical protein